MRRSRITITLNQHTLEQVDNLIDYKRIRNRSHAIEYALNQYLKPRLKTAVILAGGQGTHLRPYTYEVPKTLLPVQGKPLLEYMVAALKDSGISEIILCIGYLGQRIKDHFGSGEKFGIHIIYSEDTQPLKTGGALLKIKDRLTETFMVIHGDILTNVSPRDLIEFHQKEKSVVTIALTSVNQPSAYGQLKLHGTKLVHFYQSTTRENIQSHLVNCGMYVCEPEIFDYFPKNKQIFLLEDVIETLINEKKVTGFVFEGQWFDVGTPDHYEQAIKKFKI